MSDVGDLAAPAAEAAPETVPTAEPSLPEGESKPEVPEKTFTQAELDKIIQKRLHTESRRAEREAQARESRIQAEIEARVAKAQPQPKKPEGAPHISQFQDYESYIDALTDYKVAQNMRGVHQQTEAQRQAQQRAEFESRQKASVMPKVTAAKQKYEDFDDVALSFETSEAANAAMLKSKITGDLYYYLGSNPSEVARINEMDDPIDQVWAIKDLEAKLSAGPTVSKAPAPIVPSAGKASVSKPLGEQSYDEFVKSREAFRKRR